MDFNPGSDKNQIPSWWNTPEKKENKPLKKKLLAIARLNWILNIKRHINKNIVCSEIAGDSPKPSPTKSPNVICFGLVLSTSIFNNVNIFLTNKVIDDILSFH